MKRITFLFVLMISFISLNAENWMVFNSSNSELTDNWIDCLTIDNTGSIWIGTAGSRLYEKSGDNWSEWNLQYGQMIDLAVDSKNNIWIGSDGGPLTKFDGSEFSEYNSDKNARNVCIDPQDNIWVGNYNGLSRFDGTDWSYYDSSNSDLPYNSVISLATDINGIVWAGASDYQNGYSTLIKYDGTNWTDYPDYPPISWVQSIAFDNNNELWLGSNRNKLIHFDYTTWTEIDFPDSNLDYLGVIAVDKDNNLWCGFDNGLAKFDGQNWDIYTTENSELPEEWVTAIAIDKYNNKWIGTYGGGLAVFNENGIVVNSIDHKDRILPEKFVLYQNYPNPFNANTKIRYEIQNPENVTIRIFDITGNLVEVIEDSRQASGQYSFNWNASDYSTGVYIIQMKVGDFSQNRKCLLLK